MNVWLLNLLSTEKKLLLLGNKFLPQKQTDEIFQ